MVKIVCFSVMSSKNQRFKLKLISGQNVVLVECPGMESEIFIPTITNGRIAFKNIVPNRRCCGGDKIQKVPLHDIKNKPQIKTWRLFGGVQNNSSNTPTSMCSPLETSEQIINKENVRSTSKSISKNTPNSDDTLPSPELVRHAVVDKILDVFDQTIGLHTPAHKRNTVKATPKIDRHSTPNKNIPQNVADISTTFNLPDTPDIPKKISPKRKKAKSDSLKPTLDLSPETKWRKCLTPIRTYQKKKTDGKPTKSASATTLRYTPLKKVIPTYRANPTQGTHASPKMELRKRYLIVDKKVNISPKTFKKQQTDKPVKKFKNNLPTTRKQLIELSRRNAIDLLTNSNRANVASTKLNQQFRKSCIKKAAHTYSKYKALTTKPTLETKQQKITELKVIHTNNLNQLRNTKQQKRNIVYIA